MYRTVPTLALVTLSLANIGCGTRSSSSSRPANGGKAVASENLPRKIVVTPVASVAEVDGQNVVELAVGTEDGVTAGDLFRVYAPDRDARLKGMLQVTAVLSPQRVLARQIGLLDRSRPLAAGDEARLVRDLSALADTQSMEDAIAREQAKLDSADAEQNAAFSALRSNYQKRLGELDKLHRETVARIERQHELQLESYQAEQRRQLERIAVEHAAELAAVRAALTDEATTSLRQDRIATQQRSQELEIENRKLADQVAVLLTEAQAAELRIGELLAAAETSSMRHQRELKAEVETREVLQERVVELERRVAGRASATATSVLTNDQIRNETVLDRLKRVSAERDSARLTVSELETDLEHQKRLRARSEVRLAELEVAVGELRQQAGVRQGLGDEIGNLKRDNQRLRETGKALELSRLQAERAYFDLAARILRLDDNTSALQDLQRRLRRVLAAGDPAPVEDR
ncbi:MAG: hypothetical protein PF961_22655 [Planctomycetota bacterium]|jgi:hypothetical protein|nr:hypothetical protein [Planctomycetota bacterium]